MKKPIVIMVIIHDDLKEHDQDKLYADHFSWLKTELELVAQRDILIIMCTPGEAPELSGYHYKNEDNSASLGGWKDQLKNLFSEMSRNPHFNPNLIKFILLTRDNIHEQLGGLGGQQVGLAAVKGHYAIAAITLTQAPAHEIGHMIGATHEDSEVTYDGWWRDTIMLADGFTPLRGNAYRFSDKNRDNIREYLSRLP